MYILGIHFGHDASVSIIKNGKIIYSLEIERQNRIRHAVGVKYKHIQKALTECKCRIDDIKYCSVTSTQNIEYFFPEPEIFSFELNFKNKSHLNKLWNSEFKNLPLNKRLDYKVVNSIKKKRKNLFLKRFEEDFLNLRQNKYFGSIEKFIMPEKWKKKVEICNLDKLIFKNKFNKNLNLGMHLPINLNLNKKQIPGFIVSHHMSHASYAFYTSNFQKSAIFSHDGSFAKDIYRGGMCYYGMNNKIFPIMPHHLEIGRFYEGLSCYLGFGEEEGPGKLMGLAPYGKPVFFDKKYVGNKFSFKEKNNYNFYKKKLKKDNQNIKYSRFKTLESWILHCISKAKEKKYNLKNFGKIAKILDPINVDIASSTQKIFEETVLSTVDKIFMTYKKNQINFEDNICLTGGTNLNCPSNSNIFLKSKFKNVFVPPAIHDGGLSMGSALYTYYNILNNKKRYKYSSNEIAFLGGNKNDINLNYLKSISKKLRIKKIKKINKKIARLILQNKIVAIFNDRSEIGPRALGHRSIIANPSFKNNWKKVNKIKSRELWRPFAPAILEEDFKNWFKDCPKRTPFMLFTAKVLNKKIPAVTHVDNSARVQTVSKKTEPLYSILKELKKISDIPLVLNTSFNGPGEPIIETPDQAIKFFSKSKLDALVINNYFIEKSQNVIKKNS